MTGGCHIGTANATVSIGVSSQNAISDDDVCATVLAANRFPSTIVTDRRVLDTDRTIDITNGAASCAAGAVATDGHVREGRISAVVINTIFVSDQCPLDK